VATTFAPAPVISGYRFEQAVDLADPHVREKMSGPAMRAFLNIAREWKLTESQARGLLGGIASSTYHAWKNEPNKQKLSQDTLIRISLVIGIFKALQIYFDQSLANRWMTLGNRGLIFAGLPPIEYAIRHGQPGMMQIRRMLDAWRGGR
jgi:hypothetical protein